MMTYAFKFAFLLCGLIICNEGISAAISTPKANANSAITSTVCPLTLTDSLPCICHVLREDQAVQIICNNTQIDEIWSKLDGYNVPISKMGIRNCPNKTEVFSPIPSLKIRSLEITNCNISQFSLTAFDSLVDHLEELWLLNDDLAAIPNLNKLVKLVDLNLNMNHIKSLPDHVLHGLKNLKNLRLRNNQICNIINPLADQRNSLKLLDFSRNCFTAIPAFAIRNSLQLEHLSLADNALTEIGAMQLMGLPELTELRLQNNQLQRIVPNGFMNVPKLKVLLLHGNQLSFFDPGTLQTFKQLQFVDLSSNGFTKIPSFKDMGELIGLQLDSNRISTIETLTFSSNPKLKKISLAYNQISDIAKNSFDSLNQLEWLNLADNSLTTIHPGRLEGMRHLKDLVLRNNSIEELHRQSFVSLPELAGLDLSFNELKTLRAGTFAPFQRLSILKLENNHLETFEKGAFVAKVDTLLLDGNNLRCDDQLDWFIQWLVDNKVRTFVPDQPEIKCASPEEKRGTRLKDLMIHRSNQTSEAVINTMHGIPGLGRGGEEAGQLLANFLPGLRQAQGAKVGSQMLDTLTQSFPEIRNMPGMNFLPVSPTTPATIGQRGGVGGKALDSAFDQFSQPLVRFASGMQPTSADVNQLLQSLPSLLVNVPGIGNVDVSKLNPSMIEYVLKGGQIPGIPRETLNNIVKQYMQRLYVAAAQAQGIQPTTEMPPLPPGTNASRILRPIGELPNGLVKSVMEGNSLPHLNTEQTNVIREYYTQQAPVGQLPLDEEGKTMTAANITDVLSPRVIQMMQLLPRNYNLSKLPPDLVKQVMRGEMPDLTKLPLDLQQHIKDNFDRMIVALENTPDLSIEEILKKLPRYEQPDLPTFSPYDINTVDKDTVIKEHKALEKARFWRLCAAIALALAGAITLGVLSAFCWYWHRTGGASIRGIDEQENKGGIGRRTLPSIVREQSFRPSASSTLK